MPCGVDVFQTWNFHIENAAFLKMRFEVANQEL